MYENLPRQDLNRRKIEFSVWNRMKTGQSEFLGEVLIDLSGRHSDAPFSDFIDSSLSTVLRVV